MQFRIQPQKIGAATIHVFVTSNCKFRARIKTPERPAYEVTVNSDTWKAGKGNPYQQQILAKCEEMLESLKNSITPKI